LVMFNPLSVASVKSVSLFLSHLSLR
jgi:hypothetical protein